MLFIICEHFFLPPAGGDFWNKPNYKNWLERLLLEHNVYHIKIISGAFIK